MTLGPDAFRAALDQLADPNRDIYVNRGGQVRTGESSWLARAYRFLTEGNPETNLASAAHVHRFLLDHVHLILPQDRLTLLRLRRRFEDWGCTYDTPLYDWLATREIVLLQSRESPISVLPREAISLIFSKMSREEVEALRPVCKQWNGVAGSMRLVEDRAIAGDSDAMRQVLRSWSRGEMSIQRFLRRADPELQFALSHKIIWWIWWCQWPRDFMGTYCLTRLSLEYKFLDDEQTHAAVRRFPHVEELRMGPSDNVSDRGLASVAFHCRHLHSLQIRGCTTITDEGIALLTQSCAHLRSADLRWCLRLTDNAVIALSRAAKAHLRSLKLLFAEKTITDRSLYAISRHNRQLQELWLANATITDEGLFSLSQCYQLRELSFWSCRNLTYAGLQRLILRAPRLERVYIGGSTALTHRQISALQHQHPTLDIRYILQW